MLSKIVCIMQFSFITFNRISYWFLAASFWSRAHIFWLHPFQLLRNSITEHFFLPMFSPRRCLQPFCSSKTFLLPTRLLLKDSGSLFSPLDTAYQFTPAFLICFTLNIHPPSLYGSRLCRCRTTELPIWKSSSSEGPLLKWEPRFFILLMFGPSSQTVALSLFFYLTTSHIPHPTRYCPILKNWTCANAQFLFSWFLHSPNWLSLELKFVSAKPNFPIF